MPTLETSLRTLLETTVLKARETAEGAARAALASLAVDREEPHPSMTAEERDLRERLLAKSRQLGSLARLEEECAYEHWHRMLFARFLAENGLLIHPSGVAVTLEECAELAPDEGEPDAWAVAAQYAGAMLPGIFRQEDPVLEVRFAAEGRQRLEALLETLPSVVFTAGDALGWVYQFWQTQKKQEVNRSERKIGGDDLPPVTQLFTEPYMVQFLLHNSLGAWWAGRHPGQDLSVETDYLRRLDDGTPAAGSFPGWPDTARELRILDPCCGSGHFLVAAFDLLVHIRMAEEGLSEREAGDAVLRDNLFGLEIDPRCTQIAAFALALAAWKWGGYRELPLPNIACTGLHVGDRLYDWTHLADGDPELKAVMRRLYYLFRNAPDLGSLVDPARVSAEEGLFAIEWDRVGPLLECVLAKEREKDDPAPIFGLTAQGASRAADLLARKYHIVVTNVPYLKRGKQDDILRNFCTEHHNDAKTDLATVFLDRCLNFCEPSGVCCVITPQTWLFLGSYKKFRERLLKQKTWVLVVKLGSGAFAMISGEVVNVGLFVLQNQNPIPEHAFKGLDASTDNTPKGKANLLRYVPIHQVPQYDQFRNPDSVVLFETQPITKLLSAHAYSYAGINCGDAPRFLRCFWEFPSVTNGWEFQQCAVSQSMSYGGREHVFLWEGGTGSFSDFISSLDGRLGGSWRRGGNAWGKHGIAIARMGELAATLYTGELFDQNTAVLMPYDPNQLPAIWAFCQSKEFFDAVRRINPNLGVTSATLAKIPFDLERWQKVADEAGPLPEPHSDDPTQWLFQGHPFGSTDPFQVAVARLLGYRWPAQKETDGLEPFADADGIVCLPPVAGELPAHVRLLALTSAAYQDKWSPAVLEKLMNSADYTGKVIELWLRDDFFTAHCRFFHNRPFIWHIWDGRKDGFSALVNYHRLDRANLQKLTYTYLGDWIAQQEAGARNEVPGAGLRLAAARDLQNRLAAILEGEPPYDIYVRWKPLAQQPLGWEPDLNDGVRLNIRPFVTAGVLRSRFTINWNKDRGRDPDGSERLNDRHFSRAKKEEARRLP